MNAAHVLKRILFPTADRRFDKEVKCPTGRASFWVKFPTVRSLTRVKCPGGRGGFGIDWYINSTLRKINKNIKLTLLQFGQVHDALGTLQREDHLVSKENKRLKVIPQYCTAHNFTRDQRTRIEKWRLFLYGWCMVTYHSFCCFEMSNKYSLCVINMDQFQV